MLESLKFESGTTLFYLGAPAVDHDLVSEKLIQVFDRLTQSGGRLVLTFLPITKKKEQKESTAKDESDSAANDDSQTAPVAGKGNSGELSPEKSKSQKGINQRSPEGAGVNGLVSIKKHWGMGLAFKETLPIKDDKYQAIKATSDRPDLPSAMSWHSNLYFELYDSVWQPIYSYEGLPLVIERPYGKGSILLSTDSFFLSNEALWSERYPRLLVWMMGGNTKINFDETHFGIYKQPSVAQLLRHYRFHWFFAALCLLAVLFVWKSAAYFVPPPKDDALIDADVVSDKDYTQGLIALLRRNIAGSQILGVCASEWEQTFKKSTGLRSVSVEQIRGIIGTKSNAAKKSQDPVKEYKDISSKINRLGSSSRSNKIH
jgi:hypothetical protein